MIFDTKEIAHMCWCVGRRNQQSTTTTAAAFESINNIKIEEKKEDEKSILCCCGFDEFVEVAVEKKMSTTECER